MKTFSNEESSIYIYCPNVLPCHHSTRCGGNNKGLKVDLENECLEDEFSGFLFWNQFLTSLSRITQFAVEILPNQLTISTYGEGSQPLQHPDLFQSSEISSTSAEKWMFTKKGTVSVIFNSCKIKKERGHIQGNGFNWPPLLNRKPYSQPKACLYDETSWTSTFGWLQVFFSFWYWTIGEPVK